LGTPGPRQYTPRIPAWARFNSNDRATPRLQAAHSIRGEEPDRYRDGMRFRYQVRIARHSDPISATTPKWPLLKSSAATSGVAPAGRGKAPEPLACARGSVLVLASYQ